MLCLPLGGVSLYEVLAAYLGLILSVITFGMISVACSSYFRAHGVVAGRVVPDDFAAGAVGRVRLAMLARARACCGCCLIADRACRRCRGDLLGAVSSNTSARLLHPPDVGSEGKEVVDLEKEAQQAVGLVIQRDQFPDRLFAPAKRNDLMEDGANPVYDKEMRSEIFSQGTLMLRLVIQVSMLLAIP